MLGTLAFGSGIITRNWHLAVIGVVFSSLTAAAMWENLRARLPYLFDEWSEKLPPAPTLLHSMVAIAATVEGIGFITGMFAALGDAHTVAVARAIGYGLGSAITFVLVQNFLIKRGAAPGSMWVWQSKPTAVRSKLSAPRWLLIIAAGALVGALLGFIAIVYLKYVRSIPAVQEYLEHHRELIDAKTASDTLWWLGLLAIGFAPVAEEYLFRGLLFRALDREWGGTRALIGSAAFFAIYHPPLSWLPVGLLGLANCVLFKKSGRLAPCVVAHAIYNAIVVLLH
jgi:membrane protease YdiL (CAAX protease family)